MRILYEGRNLVWIQALLVICIAWICAVKGQDGFLSIDCGSDQDYYDNATGISWVTDANYIRTGKNVNITVPSGYGSGYFPRPNKRQVGSLRYFGEERRRNCYVLPVQSGETYLVRATFYYGAWVNGSTEFNVFAFIDNNLEAAYQYSQGFASANRSFDAEMIYSAPGNTLNFCVVSNGGPAFISALELRKLAKGMYAEVVGPSLNQVIYNYFRINCGPSEIGAVQSWRYPDDTFDRTWYLFGPGERSDIAHIRKPSISNSSNSFSEDPNRPPYVVMEDAWAASGLSSLDVNYSFPQVIGLVYIVAYFQELDGNASASNIRGMNILLNGVHMASFNSSDRPTEVYVIEKIPETYIGMSIVETDWSRLPPIMNAFEIYKVSNYSTSATAAEDVSAINALQVHFNLTDWTGDPCLPVPFNWLNCTRDAVSLRITNLSLANHGFEGNIPSEISNLTALTILDLSDNRFIGSIPNFSNLVNLQSIKLQNNDLSGQIPDFFGSAFPNLTLLELDNNTLSGTFPSGLDKQGLHLTFSNNPGLITPSWYNSSSSSPNNITSYAGKSSSSGTIIGAVVGGGGLVALAVIGWIVWMCCTWKRRRTSSIIRAMGHGDRRSSKADSSISKKAYASAMISLSLQEVNDATKKFSTKIGEGSFGPVYLGKLPNGQEVAVKTSKASNSTNSSQGMKEFLNEVELLSRIHHRNLVSLVGFCEERNQKILIYAYVSNGDLRDHLYGDRSTKPLEWRTRLDIALNSARGLEYLHTDCKPRIIHRDVKTSNILLDENMIAKVADFGISKQTPEGVFTGVDTLLKGTLGYFDPEYFHSQKLTTKSDVYSFGVVLLEIASGRHPYQSELPDGTIGTIVQWVRNAASSEGWMEIVDPSMKGNFNRESVRMVISLAIDCINDASENRPTMKQVVRTLTEAIEVELFSEIDQKYCPDATVTPIAEEEDEHRERSVFNLQSEAQSSRDRSPRD